jgi:ABC-type sugar transport system ATPase subunit
MFKLLPALADAGHAIVLASRDPSELVRLCDRIFVMANGRIIGRYAMADFSVEKLRRQLKAGK